MTTTLAPSRPARLIDRSGALDVSDIDFGHFDRHPLDGDTLRCLRYMHDIEFHTACYLRDLLVTPAHDDPELTAFLSTWAYEELWHGEALAEVLTRHDVVTGPAHVARVRRRVGRERAKTLAMMVVSGVTGHLVTAALAWGAVNELTTQAGYLQLARQSGDPVLAELLRRIARQEGRHIAFYLDAAERRLAASNGARRFTRTMLRHRWRPVGSGVMPAAETAYVIGHLFGDRAGELAAERIDRRLDRLPGLAGLHLVAAARSDAVAVP